LKRLGAPPGSFPSEALKGARDVVAFLVPLFVGNNPLGDNVSRELSLGGLQYPGDFPKNYIPSRGCRDDPFPKRPPSSRRTLLLLLGRDRSADRLRDRRGES